MYLRPRTSRRCCSVTDELAANAATAHHVGPATWFISHTWNNPFADTLEAIFNFFEQRADAANAVFWFDIFVDSQHTTAGPSKPPQWYMTTFKSSIAQIGSLLLVVDAWDDPTPLRRAWFVRACVCARACLLVYVCLCVCAFGCVSHPQLVFMPYALYQVCVGAARDCGEEGRGWW